MSDCKTGAEHIRSLKDGRTVHIDGKLVRRCHRASGVPQFGSLGGLALRLPGAAGKPRADDVQAGRREPPRQPRLADPAQPRRDGPAPEGAAGLGRTVLRLHGPLAGPPRLGAGRPAGRPRSVREAQRGARQGLRQLLRGGAPQRLFPHLRDHQSAGRARQGLGRADPRPGRGDRRRGFGGHHHPRRQDARHELDHGERGVRREPAAAETRRGAACLLVRAADEHQGACAYCRASPTRRMRCRCSTIRCRRASTRTTR